MAIRWKAISDDTRGGEEEGSGDTSRSRVAESEDSIVTRLDLEAAIGTVGSSSMTEEDGEGDSDESDDWVKPIVAGAGEILFGPGAWSRSTEAQAGSSRSSRARSADICRSDDGVSLQRLSVRSGALVEPDAVEGLTTA